MVERFGRSKITKLTAIFLAVTVILAVHIQAEEPPELKTIEVIGTGIIQNNDSQTARERAVSSGLVAVVELIVADLLPVESLIQNFKPIHTILYEYTPTFIQNYRIMAETEYRDSYKVLVQATVSVAKIKKQLTDYGIMTGKLLNPKILLLTAEQELNDLYPQYWWEVERSQTEFVTDNAMSEILRNEGFSVIDHDTVRQDKALHRLRLTPEINYEDAVQLAIRLGADAVILGSSMVYSAANVIEGGIKSYTGNVKARVFSAKTGKETASTIQTATVVHQDEFEGSHDALSKTATLAAEALVSEISRAWREEHVSMQKIEIQVAGSGYTIGNFVSLRRMLKEIDGVEEIRTRQMQSKAALIMVGFSGDSHTLAQALAKKSCEHFAVNIADVSDDHLKIELVPH